MNIELVRILATLGVAAIMAGGAYLANRFQKGTRENKLIDQLQEEITGLKTAQREANEERARERAEDRERMNRIEARDRVYIPFILRQQAHIEQGLGPPAPPIPKVILDYLNDD